MSQYCEKCGAKEMDITLINNHFKMFNCGSESDSSLPQYFSQSKECRILELEQKLAAGLTNAL